LNRDRAIQAIAIVFALVVMAGCQASNQPAGPESAQTGAVSGQTKDRTTLMHPGETASSREKERAEVPAPRKFTLPAGSPIHIRLSTELNTGTTASGSTFDGILETPLIVNGTTVVSRGSLVHGQVTNIVSSSRLKRPAEISLILTSVTPTGGEQTSVTTQPWAVSSQSHKGRDLTMSGAAAVGTAGVHATGAQEIDVPTQTQLTFHLSTPATFTVE